MSFQQIINEILNFILYPKFEGWLLTIKMTFLGFGLFFFGYTIWALFKTSWLKRAILMDLKEFFSYKPFYTKKFLAKWKKIEKRLESPIEADWKLAILEADDLLKESLSYVGYPGETVEEKLEKMPEDTISNLEELKKVRKIKEDIIEDPNFKLTQEQASQVLKAYQKALSDLQVI